MSVVSSGKFSKMTLALGAWLSAGCYSIFASISPCVPPIPLQWAPIRLNFSNMVTFVGREQRKLIFIEEQRANDQNAFQFPLFPFCSYWMARQMPGKQSAESEFLFDFFLLRSQSQSQSSQRTMHTQFTHRRLISLSLSTVKIIFRLFLRTVFIWIAACALPPFMMGFRLQLIDIPALWQWIRSHATAEDGKRVVASKPEQRRWGTHRRRRMTFIWFFVCIENSVRKDKQEANEMFVECFNCLSFVSSNPIHPFPQSFVLSGEFDETRNRQVECASGSGFWRAAISISAYYVFVSRFTFKYCVFVSCARACVCVCTAYK